MVSQFAAYLTDTTTDDEFMIVTGTAEEAQALGAQRVEAAARDGLLVEMIVAPLCSEMPYPVNQLVKLRKV